jgi:hypothetical protein
LIGLPLDRLLIPRAAVGRPRVEIEGEASPAPRGAMAILAFVFAATPAEELVSEDLFHALAQLCFLDFVRSLDWIIHPAVCAASRQRASDCRATLHALAQALPGTGRLALQALLERARLPTWRLWARDAAIEKKDVLKARGYAWSPGEFGRPKCWYRFACHVRLHSDLVRTRGD